MLSGLLHPTAGEVAVLGHAPSRREKDFLRQITLVMGQRNQLVWDIPAADSFELNRAIYRIPRPEFQRTLEELESLLGSGASPGQARAQPLPGRADEMRNRRRAPASASGGLPGRAHHRAGRDHAAQDPELPRRIQPALRSDNPPHQPLHGGRGSAVPARARDPSRPAPLRRRAGRARSAFHRAQDDRRAAAGLHRRSLRPTARWFPARRGWPRCGSPRT